MRKPRSLNRRSQALRDNLEARGILPAMVIADEMERQLELANKAAEVGDLAQMEVRRQAVMEGAMALLPYTEAKRKVIEIAPPTLQDLTHEELIDALTDQAELAGILIDVTPLEKGSNITVLPTGGGRKSRR